MRRDKEGHELAWRALPWRDEARDLVGKIAKEVGEADDRTNHNLQIAYEALERGALRRAADAPETRAQLARMAAELGGLSVETYEEAIARVAGSLVHGDLTSYAYDAREIVSWFNDLLPEGVYLDVADRSLGGEFEAVIAIDGFRLRPGGAAGFRDLMVRMGMGARALAVAAGVPASSYSICFEGRLMLSGGVFSRKELRLSFDDNGRPLFLSVLNAIDGSEYEVLDPAAGGALEASADAEMLVAGLEASQGALLLIIDEPFECGVTPFGSEASEPFYEVVVGNVGVVYSGDDERAAEREFRIYKMVSMSGAGRAAGEPVTMLKMGQIAKEYHGKKVKGKR